MSRTPTEIRRAHAALTPDHRDQIIRAWHSAQDAAYYDRAAGAPMGAWLTAAWIRAARAYRGAAQTVAEYRDLNRSQAAQRWRSERRYAHPHALTSPERTRARHAAYALPDDELAALCASYATGRCSWYTRTATIDTTETMRAQRTRNAAAAGQVQS